MKTLTALTAGAALIALTPAIAIANDADMSFAVHDVTISSNIPTLNISVRNQSNSTDPAQRNLRVTSQMPVVNVRGQVWCKSFSFAHTRADAAQVMFGNASLVTSPNGSDVLSLGTWSSSPVAQLGADETLRNYNINAPVQFPDHWNGGISLGFNPVREVEQRMQQFVQNGAGSEADFLRVDDVFETTIKLNAVGWCEYNSENLQRRHAGFRQIEVPVHIFYRGDPDIADVIVGVGTADTVQAPKPPSGPSFAPGQPSRRATPPARRAPPARGNESRTRQPSAASAEALPVSLAKRVQRVQQRVRPPVRRADPQDSTLEGGVSIASGDINGDTTVGLLLPAVQKMQDSRPQAADEPLCADLGSTLRREAARAAVGFLFGSGRSRRDPDRPTIQDRLVDSAVDEVSGCRRDPQSAD